MKKLLILSFAALISIGCSSSAQQQSNGVTTLNSNNATVKTDNSTIVSSHSTNSETNAAPANTTKSASTESPMARPIDVAEMTADIEKARKAFEKNPKAKGDLAKAYFVRATALTSAAQYRAALGDYRKGLKLDPNDAEAKTMHDKIIEIFKSIQREPPKEGEEPPPMPFVKQ